MESIATLAVLIALAGKIVEVLKYIRNKDWNGTYTQVAVWVSGVGVIWVGAQANAFQELVVPGMTQTLGQLNFGSIVLVGMTAASSLSVVYDFKKAIDGGDSAKQPPLTPL